MKLIKISDETYNAIEAVVERHGGFFKGYHYYGGQSYTPIRDDQWIRDGLFALMPNAMFQKAEARGIINGYFRTTYGLALEEKFQSDLTSLGFACIHEGCGDDDDSTRNAWCKIVPLEYEI